MKPSSVTRLLVSISAGLFVICLLGGMARDKDRPFGSSRSLAKTLTQDVRASILINNILSFYANNGDGSNNPANSSGSGFEFPKGTGKTAVYQDGFLWGGVHHGMVKVGGSTYRHGLQAGRILVPGTALTPPIADDPTKAMYRVYRIRRDIGPSTPFESVAASLDAELAILNRYFSYTALGLYEDYIRDWNEWPSGDGAPYDDINRNGLYEPGIDVPGVQGADQTLWHVSNDLDSARTLYLSGVPPIGLELRRTIWAYNAPGALGSTIFIKYQFVNMSGHDIDSMYVSQWSDPDVGSAPDDYAGCDTTLSLGYAYNSTNSDGVYGSTPPAVGFDFFQGPIVSAAPDDRAIFNGAYRTGYRNLPMSSFNIFVSGLPSYSDPPMGTTEGTRQWYNLMAGRMGITGAEYVDPTTGLPTRFVLSGDPMRGTGWIDGMTFATGDRRIVLSAGPFTMADGDTQEVVVAEMAAQGSDRLTAIGALRSVDRVAQSLYSSLFMAVQPDLSADVSYPDSTHASIRFLAQGGLPSPDSIRLCLRRVDGSIVDSLDLSDDGSHGDGIAGDGVFGGDLTASRERGALSCDLRSTSDGTSYHYERVLESLTTSGTIEILGPYVFSDSYNNNGRVNPGENIRYGFSLLNGTIFTLDALTATPSPEQMGRTLLITGLSAGSEYSRPYAADDPDTYFSFNVDPAVADSVISIVVVCTDTLYNVWVDTLRLAVERLSVPAYGTPAPRIAGTGDWDFATKVVDRSALSDHYYEVTIQDAEGTKRFTLRDATSGDTLLAEHELPDEYAHNIPVTDGFKLMRGPSWGSVGLNKELTAYHSSAPPWFGGSRFTQDPHAAFAGGVTTGYQLGTVPYLAHFVSCFDYEGSVRTEVRFDAASPQKAYRLRRSGPATEYQLQTSVRPGAPAGEVFVDVPFQVWDVSLPDSPRQLTVSWRDQTDDGFWNPPVGSNDGVEIVFVHFRTYDPLGRQYTYPTNPEKPGEVINNELTMGSDADVMYGLSLGVLSGHVLNESAGVLAIVPATGLRTDDRFLFRTEVAPPIPVPGGPVTGTMNVHNRTRLWWEMAEGADRYRLQVATDSLFSAVIYDDEEITETVSPLDELGNSRLLLDWGTTYYWRVRAINLYGSSSWSVAFQFMTRIQPPPWSVTAPTGRNATIAIPMSSAPRIGRRALQTGDAVGVLFTRNDSLICGGYGTWTDGNNLAVTAWGDDDQTAVKDGFAEAESLRFTVWDGLAGRQFPASVTFASGSGVFATDGISTVSSLVGQCNVTYGVAMPQGWNMISSFVTGDDSSFSRILEHILPSMVLLKNGRGQVFWPSLSINTIGSWELRDGYQVYLTASDTLWVCGEEISPFRTPITLAKGWNLVGYLRNRGLGPDTAWASIRDRLVLAKNNAGEVYLPSFGIDNIGRVKRGHGYQMYLSSGATLRYAANTSFASSYPVVLRTLSDDPRPKPEPVRYKLAAPPTGNNAVVVVESRMLRDGDEVAVWDAEHRLVGSAAASNGRVAVTVWGDNAMTEAVEGPDDGGLLKLSVWSPISQELVDDPPIVVMDLLSRDERRSSLRYERDGAFRVVIDGDGSTPSTYTLSQNYPNPFNPTTVVRFGIPQTSRVLLEVFNLVGQKVQTLVDEERKPGHYEVELQCGRWSSGVYFYRLMAGGYHATKKMVLIR